LRLTLDNYDHDNNDDNNNGSSTL